MTDSAERAGRLGVGSVVLGRYRLDEQVAAGGMGVLWRATDTVLEGTVALKRVSFAHLSEEQARITRDRTLREARLAAKLRGHPHVVSLYDIQLDDGDVWLVLEYVPSRSLAQILHERGALPPTEVARIGADVADALVAAHALDIQHRDVTPGNVLIGSDGRVKLTDFGIAHSANDPRITQTGAIVGTIPYVSPEVARDGESSAASDVFSLGATMYAALEGQPPFGRHQNSVKLLHIVSTGIIRPPERAGVLEPILLRLLELNPSTRPDPATVRDSLRRLRDSDDSEDDSAAPQAPPVADDAATTAPPGGRARHADVTGAADTTGSTTTAHRRRHVALRVLGAIVAVLLVVTVFVFTKHGDGTPRNTADTPHPTVPALPEFVPATRMPADLRKVDNCGLIDQRVLGQFGHVRLVRGTKLYSCGAYITAPDGGVVSISYEATEPGSEYSDEPQVHDHHDLGGMRVFQGKLDPTGNPACKGAVFLSDNSGFFGYAEANNVAGRKVDLCTMMRALDYATVNRIARHGVPQSDWAQRIPLAHPNGCTMIDPKTLGSIDGLNYRDGYWKFAHWGCHWGHGAGDNSEPSVDTTFNLSTVDFLRHQDTVPVTIAAHTAYQTTAYQQNADPDKPWECWLTLPLGRKLDNGKTVQTVTIQVTSPNSPAANCGHAKTMAAAIRKSFG